MIFALSLLAALARLAMGVLLIVYAATEPGRQLAEVGVALLLFYTVAPDASATSGPQVSRPGTREQDG